MGTVRRWSEAVVIAVLVSGMASGAVRAQAGDAREARTLERAAPAEAGMSTALLEAGLGLYRESVERGDLVGAVLLVARHGKVVLYEAVGMRDREAGLPMEPTTMFRMASNTKPVVATAVNQLVERGRLRYTDNVRQYIPSFDNWKSGFINVHHLLTHTGGFRINALFLEPYDTPTAAHPDAPTLQGEVSKFGAVGAAAIPGTSYSYSNPGYNTLGALVEMVSGKRLDEYLRENVYEPLGMVDTYHHETAAVLGEKLSRMGAVYYRKRAGEWVAGWKPGDPPQVPFVRASGGMISTAWDYAIFLQTFLNGGEYGGVRILEAETVERMTSVRFETGPDRGYGYGWMVAEDGTFSHSGSDGTFAWVDPAHDVIGLVFTQTPSGPNPRARFVEQVKLAIVGE
ncbi:MAG: serine hydrolase domain-containing protein [Gemmatimonadota bacterium]|jgi:CubicO group peptidase (beta-lactamase class C family)